MMTRTILQRTAVFMLIVGAGFAIPAEAWAGIIERVEVAEGYYQEILGLAGILTGLWVVDTVTWPYLTGQD